MIPACIYCSSCSSISAPGRFQGIAGTRNRLPFWQEIPEQHGRPRFKCRELLVAEEVDKEFATMLGAELFGRAVEMPAPPLGITAGDD